MVSIGKSILEGVVNGLKDSQILQTCTAAASAVYNTIKNAITDSGFAEKGRSMIRAVKTGLEDSNILGQIGTAAANLINTAANAANLSESQRNSFVSAGIGLGNALISGMTSRQSSLNAAIESMVAQASQAAQNKTNNLGALYAKMGGSLSAEADIYGDYGDSNTDIIIDLLARYLPMIVANDNYSNINRSLGLGLS